MCEPPRLLCKHFTKPAATAYEARLGLSYPLLSGPNAVNSIFFPIPGLAVTEGVTRRCHKGRPRQPLAWDTPNASIG
jgi:hypothetical protein